MRIGLYFPCLLFLLLLSSCGALRISPRSCMTEAFWGSRGVKAHTIDEKPIYFIDENSELDQTEVSEKMIELKTKEDFFVIADMTVRLKDLLADHQVNCEDVKKLSVKMESKFFFWREVTLKISKNL